MTPHERLAGSVDASRPCTDKLRDAFRITGKRTVRRSDGTVSAEGIRYQIPAPWRHLREVRYARWDLASVDLVDGGERLCTLYPQARQCRRGSPSGRPRRRRWRRGGWRTAAAAQGHAQ